MPFRDQCYPDGISFFFGAAAATMTRRAGLQLRWDLIIQDASARADEYIAAVTKCLQCVRANADAGPRNKRRK
jgi:hypothetical protein